MEPILRGWTVWCLVMAVLTVVGIASPNVVPDERCLVQVHPGSSIQEALDEVPEDGVVCLGEGTWTEHLIITQSVRLQGQGAGRSVLRAGEPNIPVFHVVSAGETAEVVLERLGITGGWGAQGMGILAEGCTRITVEACALYENEGGMWVEGSAHVKVISSVIARNGVGLVGLQSSRVEVERSVISSNDFDGVWLWGMVQAWIVDSIIAGNKDGVVLWGVAQATIERSVVALNDERGIMLKDSAQLRASENRIIGNGRYGVGLYACPCTDTHEGFTGSVAGVANMIVGSRSSLEDAGGAVCPTGLGFLKTEGGGKLVWDR